MHLRLILVLYKIVLKKNVGVFYIGRFVLVSDNAHSMTDKETDKKTMHGISVAQQQIDRKEDAYETLVGARFPLKWTPKLYCSVGIQGYILQKNAFY